MDATSSEPNTDRELIHEFSYDADETDSIVVTLSKAVSDVTDTPMDEMPPLQETVDCDALENLFDSFSDEGIPGIGQVQFPFNGCTVRVDTTGTIQVYSSAEKLSFDGSRC